MISNFQISSSLLQHFVSCLTCSSYQHVLSFSAVSQHFPQLFRSYNSRCPTVTILAPRYLPCRRQTTEAAAIAENQKNKTLIHQLLTTQHKVLHDTIRNLQQTCIHVTEPIHLSHRASFHSTTPLHHVHFPLHTAPQQLPTSHHSIPFAKHPDPVQHQAPPTAPTPATTIAAAKATPNTPNIPLSRAQGSIPHRTFPQQITFTTARPFPFTLQNTPQTTPSKTLLATLPNNLHCITDTIPHTPTPPPGVWTTQCPQHIPTPTKTPYKHK